MQKYACDFGTYLVFIDKKSVYIMLKDESKNIFLGF